MDLLGQMMEWRVDHIFLLSEEKNSFRIGWIIDFLNSNRVQWYPVSKLSNGYWINQKRIHYVKDKTKWMQGK